MGAKIGGMGFKRNVHINSPIYDDGKRQREIAEAAAIAEITGRPADLYEQIAHHLKPLILGIVERAFKRYAHAHHAKPEQIEEEWKRFKKILNGML